METPQNKPLSDIKVMMVMGDPAQIGQLLTNVYGMNPKLKVINTIVTQAVRQIQTPQISLQQQPQFEPITVIYLVYTNPGELIGVQQQPVKDSPITSTLKN